MADLALTTAMQVLDAAFLGSAGAAAWWLDGKSWPEAQLFLKIMAAHREYRNAAYVRSTDRGL